MNRIRKQLSVSVVVVSALLSLTAAPASAATTTFTDGADDAYRLPEQPGWPISKQPPNPTLSDPTADILSVTLTNVASTRKQLVSYSVSMTITGTPDAGYSYVVAGDFGSSCTLYHFLTPGYTARANAFCDINGQYTYIGYIDGGAITVNGSTTSAVFTYDPRRLPAQLKADRELSPVYGYSCVSGAGGRGCHSNEVLDVATGGLLSSFTI